jgi:phosphoribosylamine--glycine ligase
MKVLVVGGGGREHALVWKIKQSPLVSEVYAAPGNAGMADLAYCVPVDPSNIVEIADFAEQVRIDFTVVGPELPLTLGIVNEFTKRGLAIFGPTSEAAEVEGSKVYAKEFMEKRRIPTARFKIATSYEEAIGIIQSCEFGYPLVIKTDGLAGGKGTMIANDEESAVAAVDIIMKERRFGNAGDRLVIEEFLEGEEASFQVVTDGIRVVPLASSKDHKRAYDGDKGPNTGGMGAFSPAVSLDIETNKRVLSEIVYPAIRGLAEDGRSYRGVLYLGLMITRDGPRVLEFNCRFGDPESQVVLPRLESDLVPLLEKAAAGSLEGVSLSWLKEAAVCVILASEGYPGSYKKGLPISGVEETEKEGVLIFHAGTKKENEKLVTAGGRVLGVTALGASFPDAIVKVYSAVDSIKFPGIHYRKDIGKKTSPSVF